MNRTVRVVVVEDQPVLLESLRRLIDDEPGFSCVGTARTVADALIIIPGCSPDMVIMDIELGDQTAFDILKELMPLTFRVVFATAFKDYAIKAIKYGALDYLLKPIERQDLVIALQKVMGPIPATEQVELAQQHLLNPRYTGRIAIRNQGVIEIVEVAQIMYVESSDGTKVIMQDGRCIFSKKAIKDFEELLPWQQFYRIHAACLVNIAFAHQFRPPAQLILHDGTALEVSVRRKDGLVAFLVGKR